VRLFGELFLVYLGIFCWMGLAGYLIQCAVVYLPLPWGPALGVVIFAAFAAGLLTAASYLPGRN
jgi:hypothetical protein